MRRLFRLLLTSCAVTALVLGSPVVPVHAQTNDEWTRPFPPFRLIGNIYWVGSYDLSSYLITTPQGHILVNTGVGDTATQIAASVRTLGFDIRDVKVLTATHGHYDHVAGMAELKRMTGARLLVAAEDKELLETGGRADFRFGQTPSAQFPPVTVDGTFRDGETIALGGTSLTAHHHGGHTKGATSFTLTVTENGTSYRVVIANMGSINPGVRVTGMPGYPTIGDDYARTFLVQKDLPVDVWLASHASQFGLHQKYAPGDPYSPTRFVDPDGYRRAVQQLERTFLTQRDAERAGR
mgnify:CR=1 FL=1